MARIEADIRFTASVKAPGTEMSMNDLRSAQRRISAELQQVLNELIHGRDVRERLLRAAGGSPDDEQSTFGFSVTELSIVE